MLVRKAEKRKLEEGKETEFYHCGTQITMEKFESFKKRKSGSYLSLEAPEPSETIQAPLLRECIPSTNAQA